MAGNYVVDWVGAHVAFGVGAAGLGCAAAGPTCIAAVEGALGIGASVSADGDPTNELQTINKSIQLFYPSNGGFINGTTNLITIQPGEILSRFGSSYGQFLSPVGTPIWARSLPPGVSKLPEHLYQVMTPIENVLSGKTASWWGQIGGGIQYYIGSPYGQNVNTLIQSGILKELY